MISYQIAKDLSEAGFPNMRVLKKGDKLVDPDGKIHSAMRDVVESRYDWFRLPTLSELIEACGFGFDGVTVVERFHASKDRVWKAQANTTLWDIKDEATSAVGSTPEEAVARLWLALNKK